jgi:transcriptional regulator with XRE-family HTH domain
MGMREIDGKAFGRRLQNLLDQTGVSQHELARRTGIRQQTISEWMLENQVPSYNRLLKIAAALHMSIFDLLGYSPAEIMDELSKHRRSNRK